MNLRILKYLWNVAVAATVTYCAYHVFITNKNRLISPFGKNLALVLEARQTSMAVCPGSNRQMHPELRVAVRAAAAKYDLDQTLLLAVVATESACKTDAVSPKGARGAMQVMPATGAEVGTDELERTYDNVFAGASYLRKMLDQFGDEKLALAAYNCGPACVRRAKGIPKNKETSEYVRKVTKLKKEII
ncbi:lytic transglycosylase domain-containing protein [bacterium]|nr:lytic transglycosylase domain-containing protein [bacterium]